MLRLGLGFCVFGLLATFSNAIPVPTDSALVVSKRATGFHIPFERRKLSSHELQSRGTVSGSSGLGNNADLIYTVPIELGSTVTAVHLDTGSADLWVVTDQCTTKECTNPDITRLPSASLNESGTSVTMRYGDSQTGTQASGPVVFDTATIAGISMKDQSFCAVNSTTSNIVKFGSAGIFGLGFPSGSVVQKALVRQDEGDLDPDSVIEETFKDGPLLSRIVSTGELEEPLFSISLQRNTIDIGGGTGMLTVGKLPDGVNEDALTWVPVRLYSPEDGGLDPPSFAPDEVYPFRWEIDIDGVYLNGERLPDSTIATSDGVDATRTSALIDTGNSLLRGPKDVVDGVWAKVAPAFNPNQVGRAPIVPCRTPINLSFQIGGKMFPVDPRDFISDLEQGDTTNCVADNLVTTDPPSKGALFRWSLGDPFFRSNLVAFHYGNLTHPSEDPPMIGLFSNVPSNADELLQEAVNDAQENGGIFESTLALAPTAQAAAETQTILTNTLFDSNGSPTSTETSDSVAVTTEVALNNNQANSAPGGRLLSLDFIPYLFLSLLYLAL